MSKINFQILKFGGTSMSSKTSLKNVIDVIKTKIEFSSSQNSNQNLDLADKIIVVVSAISGTTDELLGLATLAKENRFEIGNYEKLQQKHIQILADFGLNFGNSALKSLFVELLQILTQTTLIQEIEEMAYFDLVVSFGERMSANLLTEILNSFRKHYLQAEFVDARDFLATDSNFGNANIDLQKSKENWQLLQNKLNFKISVLTGFIARGGSGGTTTLGRGGSDLTAAVMASLTDSKVVEIWTDVDGVLSSDPRNIENTKLVQNLSYREAFEVAYYGGKVIFPKTIEVCLTKNIEILIKNTFFPKNPGTKIEKTQIDGLKVVSLATKITLVEIVFAGKTSQIGLLAYIFGEFAKNCLTIDVVTTSGDSVSFSCDKTPNQILIKKIETEIGQVTVWENQEIVAIIGANLKNQPKFGKILEFINGSKPKMISMNTKNTNLTAVVEQNQGLELVQKIHSLIL